MYYKDICDKIDELRAERGLSRREIARRAGINENTFASYFKRKRGSFPEEQIEAVARVLEVPTPALKGANLRVLGSSDNDAVALNTAKMVLHLDKLNKKETQKTARLLSDVQSILSPENTDQTVYEIMFAMKKLDANDLRFLRAHIDYLLSKEE